LVCDLEDILKLEWKTKIIRKPWRGSQHNFYKIAHEHLYVFRKPGLGERPSQYKHSAKWWQALNLRNPDMVNVLVKPQGRAKRPKKTSGNNSQMSLATLSPGPPAECGGPRSHGPSG
jgi:hypothetical protein